MTSPSTYEARKPCRSKLLAIVLRLWSVNPDTHDPLEFDNSHRLGLIAGRVKSVVEMCFMKNPPYGVMNENDEDGRSITIYFPFIVVDDDPIYRVLTRLIAKSLDEARFFTDTRERYGRVVWSSEGNQRQTVSIETEPRAVEAFPPNLQSGCEGVSVRHILAQQEAMTTAHTISLVIDRFTVLLEYFTAIHEVDQDFFARHIRYIAGAYHHHRKHTTYAERERSHVTCSDWVEITNKFDIDPDLAARYFREVEDYAYTTVTMEEILRDYRGKIPMNKTGSPTWIADKLDNHNASKLRHDIKTLITQEREPSHEQLWEVFSSFIRHDHFYADGKIWVLDEMKCVHRGPNELRPVIRKFVSCVRDTKLGVLSDAFVSDISIDLKVLDKRINGMCSPFENRTSENFAEKACSNFLCTQMKTAIKRTAIPFRDTVLVFDQNAILTRKAYMEDQFTSTAPVAVKDFGMTERSKKAIFDVKDVLKKMFVHDENIHWNVKWMGSLLAHRPERVCSIWYGPKGGNAKTTLSKILLWILGEFAVQCRPDILITNKNGGQTCTPFESELKDRVLAVMSEPQKHQVYSASTLKDMTGSDIKIAAKKFKDPEQFEQTAKVLILSNHIPQFDDVTQPLTDCLFISHCYGRFTTEAPRNLEQQRKEHHYPADNDFWTEERKQALAWIMIYEGFPAYIKEGLIKTSWQRKELTKWTNENSDFMRFAELCKPDHDGKFWLTTAVSVFNVFKQKFPRKYDNLPYSSFLEEFGKTTERRVMERKSIDGQDWFEFYHPDCTDCVEI